MSQNTALISNGRKQGQGQHRLDVSGFAIAPVLYVAIILPIVKYIEYVRTLHFPGDMKIYIWLMQQLYLTEEVTIIFTTQNMFLIYGDFSSTFIEIEHVFSL